MSESAEQKRHSHSARTQLHESIVALLNCIAIQKLSAGTEQFSCAVVVLDSLDLHHFRSGPSAEIFIFFVSPPLPPKNELARVLRNSEKIGTHFCLLSASPPIDSRPYHCRNPFAAIDHASERARACDMEQVAITRRTSVEQ